MGAGGPGLPAAVPQAVPAIGGQDGLRLTIPLEITLRLGGASPAAAAPLAGGRTVPDEAFEEAIRIDPDYASRRGYDPAFLGADSDPVPLPSLPDDLLAKAVRMPSATGEPSYVLPYHHFSVVMNKDRRLAFYTAVNVDGRLSQRLKREPDRWFLDPRVPASEQTGEAVYAENDLDRGHLVRRLDPAWGRSRGIAKPANDDTFHFTNCTPQHKDFNQNKTTWAGLENYILENAANRDLKVSVFNGPVFASDDDEYRGVRLPRQFWKVVVMAKQTGQLSATAYLLSQESLLTGLEVAEEFSYGAYRAYQVPVSRIEDLTGLSFDGLRDFDPLGALEAQLAPREIESRRDLVL
jgi:endonuclease G, mitochondrial